MSDELEARSAERGLVRIARTREGRAWQVTARVGDTADELRQALDIAREIEQKLREDDPPPKK